MNTIDREVSQAVKNLSTLDRKAVPTASAMAVNRIAMRARSRSIKATSKEVKITQSILRDRVRVTKATHRSPVAYIRVKRHGVPAIAIGTARTQIKRKRGRMMISAERRDRRGRYKKREFAGYTSIRVGRHKFDNAFLQKMPSGAWHIMQRTSEARYPIKVCRVPIAEPITRAFKKNSEELMKTDMKKEIASAMKHRLRLIIRRGAARGN